MFDSKYFPYLLRIVILQHSTLACIGIVLNIQDGCLQPFYSPAELADCGALRHDITTERQHKLSAVLMALVWSFSGAEMLQLLFFMPLNCLGPSGLFNFCTRSLKSYLSVNLEYFYANCPSHTFYATSLFFSIQVSSETKALPPSIFAMPLVTGRRCKLGVDAGINIRCVLGNAIPQTLIYKSTQKHKYYMCLGKCQAIDIDMYVYVKGSFINNQLS